MSVTKFHCQPSLWERKATKAALGAGIDPVQVLAGKRHRPYTVVRWQVWRELCGKGYSYNSVGKASGFDHTAVRNAVLKDCVPFAGVWRSGWRNRSGSV